MPNRFRLTRTWLLATQDPQSITDTLYESHRCECARLFIEELRKALNLPEVCARCHNAVAPERRMVIHAECGPLTVLDRDTPLARVEQTETTLPFREGQRVYIEAEYIQDVEYSNDDRSGYVPGAMLTVAGKTVCVRADALRPREQPYTGVPCD